MYVFYRLSCIFREVSMEISKYHPPAGPLRLGAPFLCMHQTHNQSVRKLCTLIDLFLYSVKPRQIGRAHV